MTNTEERKEADKPPPENIKAELNEQVRKPVLGKVKTDEEARLAAEIEKLRD